MDHPSNIGLGQDQPALTKKIATMTILTAAAVSTNYLLIGAVNIKLMDLIVFTGGYLHGSLFGTSLGVLIWLVYGTMNPYGFNLPTLIATSLSEALYGIFGGIIRGRVEVKRGLNSSLRFGVIGFFLTLIYDIITNVATAWIVGIPVSAALIAGIPFSLLHQVSNTVFFAVGFPPLIQALRVNDVVK